MLFEIFTHIDSTAHYPITDIPNKRAINHLIDKRKYQKEYIFSTDDLSHSLGGVLLRYKKDCSGKITGSIRDTYTFIDETDETVGVSFPYLDFEGSLCCWKGGNFISDVWMGDLERHGFAKSFKINVDWELGQNGWVNSK